MKNIALFEINSCDSFKCIMFRNEDDMTTKLTGIIKLNQEIQAHCGTTPLKYIMVCLLFI